VINKEVKNLTSVLEFHIMALTEDPELQLLLFGLFLAIYLVTVLGNLLIIMAIIFDSHLHTPMYFFLYSLSFIDIFLISTTVPKMIMGINMHRRVISYIGFIMNPCVCVILVLLSFSVSIFNSQVHNLIALQVTCFKDVEIENYFCHPSQLLNLACNDILSSNTVIYFIGVILGIFPLLGIIFSYSFSTCGSHMLVVCLSDGTRVGTRVGVYLGSAVSHSPRKNAVDSLIFTAVSP
uniref:Olfactory receptor family 7 subfamily E member 173 n=1 Tax=Cricetulus griseus TaxID=10029 RepID=A0A8C2QI13_CRIGR